jgi:hypothetical protein
VRSEDTEDSSNRIIVSRDRAQAYSTSRYLHVASRFNQLLNDARRGDFLSKLLPDLFASGATTRSMQID